MTFVSTLAKFIIYIIGFDLSSFDRKIVEPGKRVIMIFPHTSYIDFMLFILVIFAYEQPAYALIAELWFNHPWAKFLFKKGFIPIRNKEDGGSGGVSLRRECF
jgi:1-acyl-sn-glycerol-3-phosphate acyltransferase